MSTDFEKLPWHDAQLMGISIDRTQPGHRDEVQASIRWPDGTESTLVFREVYAFRGEMNFGVIADESILCACVAQSSEELVRIRHRWAPLGISLEDLKCYEIETSSTGSAIRIYARSFDSLPVPGTLAPE